jgi:hypothetical protein
MTPHYVAWSRENEKAHFLALRVTDAAPVLYSNGLGQL